MVNRTYLAKYTTNSSMYDGGAWMPDPEPHKDEYRFQANGDKQAQRLAEEHKRDIGKRYFGPSVTLDSLVRIEDVYLKK